MSVFRRTRRVSPVTSTRWLRRVLLMLSSLALLLVRTEAPGSAAKEESDAVPFRYVGGHVITVPVLINDSIHKEFILDTGVGINLLPESLARKLQCHPDSTISGRRMSGQEVKTEISTVSALSCGKHRMTDVPVGILKLKGFLPDTEEFSNIIGFLSLDFFKETPLTIDYGNRLIHIENEQSLKKRAARGTCVPIKVQTRDRINTSVMLKLRLPCGKIARTEVDTGSSALILDSKFMKMLKIDPTDKSVKKVEGKDETGFSYCRWFTRLPGTVSVKGAPQVSQTGTEVMFQKIIHDGLVGDSFLRRFVVTFDLPRSRMIFSRPEKSTPTARHSSSKGLRQASNGTPLSSMARQRADSAGLLSSALAGAEVPPWQE